MDACKITFGEVARSAGKVYVHLGCPAAAVRAVSLAPSKRTVPAEAYPLAKDSWVACVPTLVVPQHLTVWALDGNGRELASKTLTIRPPLMPLRTSKGQQQKDYDSLALRNAGECQAPFDIRILRALDDPVSGETIITGQAERFLAKPEQPDLQICSYSLNGKALDAPWVDLGASVSPSEDYPTCSTLRHGFSLRVPSTLPGLVIDVQLGDLRHFFALEPKTLEDKREDWRRRTTTVEWDERYGDWINYGHRAKRGEIETQRLALEAFSLKPRFSIVVPLYKTPLRYLRAMVDSVLAQSYPYFELLLVNASPDDRALRREVETYCAADERVRHIPLEANLGITENTNEGIRAATGDFVAFLDHDDVIEGELLYRYAEGINRYPTTDLLYCDEDHLRGDQLIAPFFKPDWDPELLCFENYVCHMLAVRKTLVDALPALPDSHYDGAQDHNLTFLVGEQARNVYHARRVLYHWRIHRGSTAAEGAGDEKSYALEAQRRAVQEHLERTGIPATAQMGLRVPGRCELVYQLEEHPLVSIVVARTAGGKLDRCLQSLLEKTAWPNFELIVVDPVAAGEGAYAPAQDPRVRSLSPNLATPSLAAALNAGCAGAKGSYVLFLSDRAEVVDPAWVEQLVGPCLGEGIGAVGCKLLYPDGTYQHVGLTVSALCGPSRMDVGLPQSNRGSFECDALGHRVLAASSACLLVKKNLLDKVGGLDERLSGDLCDADLCLRIRAAGKAVFIQNATSLVHHVPICEEPDFGKRRGLRQNQEYELFMGRWYDTLLEGDPYYCAGFEAIPAYHTLSWRGNYRPARHY